MKSKSYSTLVQSFPKRFNFKLFAPTTRSLIKIGHERIVVASQKRRTFTTEKKYYVCYTSLYQICPHRRRCN